MHLAYIWIVYHRSAKNYQNWWKFDEVLSKTNLLSFFGTRCIIGWDMNLRLVFLEDFVTAQAEFVVNVYRICEEFHSSNDQREIYFLSLLDNVLCVWFIQLR